MIRTPRCELASVRPEDIEPVVRLYRDADVRRYLGGPRDREAIDAAFLAMLQSGGTHLTWAIRLSPDEAFLGLAVLGPHHDGTDTEVSYMLLPEFWRSGYATEAVGAVVDYALMRLGHARIVAETQAANRASCELLERLGFTVGRTVRRFAAEQVIYVSAPAEQPGR